MRSGPKTLVYYERSAGRYPFLEWLLSLKDPLARRRVDRRLLKLEAGNPGHWRSVGDGIIELKEDFGPGYRLYLAEQGQAWVVLLAGGDKSSQMADIAAAKGYWSDHRKKVQGGQDA